MRGEILLESSEDILKDEKLVLGIIQEYLSKNKTFNKTEILPFINAKLGKTSSNLSNYGVYEILKLLIRKNLIVEGSKLTKYDIFSNPNRKKIFEYILKNPGVHYSKLVKTFQISPFSAQWHLKMLIKFNIIRKKKIEKFEAFYDAKMSSENDYIYHIISREKCKRILQYFKQNNEGYSKNYISRTLSIHSNTVSKYFKKLESYDLLSKKDYQIRLYIS